MKLFRGHSDLDFVRVAGEELSVWEEFKYLSLFADKCCCFSQVIKKMLDVWLQLEKKFPQRMSSWRQGDTKKALMREQRVWELGKQKENPGMLITLQQPWGIFCVFR